MTLRIQYRRTDVYISDTKQGLLSRSPYPCSPFLSHHTALDACMHIGPHAQAIIKDPIGQLGS